ncbi:hypothetical protein, partial [Streptococcus suis]
AGVHRGLSPQMYDMPVVHKKRPVLLKQVSLFNILPETSRIDDNITEFSASYSLDLLTIISKIPRNSRIFFWK